MVSHTRSAHMPTDAVTHVSQDTSATQVGLQHALAQHGQLQIPSTAPPESVSPRRYIQSRNMTPTHHDTWFFHRGLLLSPFPPHHPKIREAKTQV